MPQLINTAIPLEPTQDLTSFHSVSPVVINHTTISLKTKTDNNKLSIVAIDPSDSNRIIAEANLTVLKHNGLQEEYITQDATFKGLARTIYTDFILQNYNYLLSDSTMTEQGFAFWKKLYYDLHQLYNFKILNKSTKEVYPIADSAQMNQVFSKNPQDHYNHFVIVAR